MLIYRLHKEISFLSALVLSFPLSFLSHNKQLQASTKVQEEFVNPYPIPRVIHCTLYLGEVLFKTGHCTHASL
jgi:hypothetical protein